MSHNDLCGEAGKRGSELDRVAHISLLRNELLDYLAAVKNISH